MSAVRRLAAILAADVVGYSRLMGEDEAGTARAVREHRDAAMPIVTAHGGRVVKTMGDGLLLEFPSIVAALECGMAVQRLMTERNTELADDRRMVYRIGLHLGDVLIEDDDILGDGVNIAARLEGIAEPGGIYLSEDAYRQVRGKVAAAFADLGLHELKNIAHPIRVFAVASDHLSAQARVTTPAPRLSIVVLPFANIGDNPKQEYFVDGVTESLTTDLSRLHDIFVVARNTAFTYKGKASDVRRIGRELNVRYVLEGSVQRGGNRMRVNVQFVSTETGNQLWADRFDKPLADLFDMQDEIVTLLARALHTQLVAAEARRAARSPHPDSMDLFFQGRACLNSGLTPENMARARDFFQRALSLDPTNLQALVGVANVDTMTGGAFYTPDRAELLKKAEATLTKALTLAPNHAAAHMLSGMVKMWTNRATEGIAECERALELDRNLADVHVAIAMGKIFIGRGGEAKVHVEQALRLSPRDPIAYLYRFTVGNGEFYSGRLEEAVAWLRRSIETNRNFPLAHFYLAAALALLGRQEEAKTSAASGFTFDPKFSIRGYRAGAATDNATYLAQRNRLIEGLRAAGVPEG
jgi:TolB-like protein